MRRSRILLLGLTVTTVLVGCGSPQEPGSTGSAPSGPKGAVLGMAEVQELLAGAEDLDIVIFSDSTADEVTEWPALWAQEMSTDHAVTLSRWLRGPEQYQSTSLSTHGPGRAVWSCSVSGWKPLNFYEFVEDCMPEPAELVILSLGHNNNSEPGQAVPQLTELVGRVQAASPDPVPVVVTVQNPVTLPDRLPAADQVTEEVRGWATDQGYPVIDVHQAFQDSPEDLSTLLKDGLHPSEAGSVLWADTVVDTLTPAPAG